MLIAEETHHIYSPKCIQALNGVQFLLKCSTSVYTDVVCCIQHDSVLFLTSNFQSQLLGLPDEGTATKF